MSQSRSASAWQRRRRRVALLATLAALTLARGATSQPLFDSDELLELRLSAALRELAASKEDEQRCYRAGQLSYASADGVELIPVPYDIDFAGIINAPYATPPLPIKSVRQRFYRGRCVAPEVWSATVARFQADRADIDALFDDFEPLSAQRKKRARRYIDKFYDVFDDPQQTRRRLLDNCAG